MMTKDEVGIVLCTIWTARSNFAQPFFSTSLPTKRMRLEVLGRIRGQAALRSVPDTNESVASLLENLLRCCDE